MPLTHDTAHATEARDRLLEQFKGVPGMSAVLDAFNAQTQAIEDALWDLFTGRWLDTALGAQVDVIGRIFDEPRAGFADAQYVARLRAKIRVLRSSGGPLDILKIFKLMLPSNTLRFTSIGGAGFVLDVGAVDTSLLDIYTRFLHEAKSAGVHGQIQYTDVLAHTFRLSDNPTPTVTENDSLLGLGDAGNPATGGTLAGVIV